SISALGETRIELFRPMENGEWDSRPAIITLPSDGMHLRELYQSLQGSYREGYTFVRKADLSGEILQGWKSNGDRWDEHAVSLVLRPNGMPLSEFLGEVRGAFNEGYTYITDGQSLPHDAD